MLYIMHYNGWIIKFAPCIHMAKYCASCIKIMAQSCAPWLNAVHPRLIDVHQASTVSIAQCCASGINVAVHHASIWFDACIHGSMMCIRHQYGLCCVSGLHVTIWLIAVHQVSLWHNYYDMTHCPVCLNLWPNDVHHTSWYDSNLCIMYQYGLIQHNSSH